MNRAIASILLAACWLALVPGWPATAAGQVVTLGARATPASITLSPGDELTIRNEDGERHRLRAREPEDVDTSDLEPGASAVLTFPVTGRYVLVDERSEDPAYWVSVDVRSAAPSPSPSPAPAETSGDGGAGGAPSGSTTGDTSGGTGTTPQRTATVTIPDEVFSPDSVTIAAGGTVTWENLDGNHTVTAEDRSWDSGVFDSGRFQHTFPSAGQYGYLCLLHPDMRGTVRVVGSSTTGTSPASPPSSDGPSDSAPPSSAAPSGGRPSGGAGSGAGAGAGSVAIRDLAFSPAVLRVPVGTNVRWTNRGEALHNVVSTDGGPLGSGFLGTGDTYRARLDRAGEFAYRCELHPAMTGRVVVTRAGGAGSSDEPQDASDTGDATDAPATGDPGDTPTPSEGRTHELAIGDLEFSPARLTVSVGDRLVWENGDVVPHTVTSTGDGPFRSEMLAEGDRYEVVATEVGSFPYLCAVHPEMTGEIVVTSDAAASADGDAGDRGGSIAAPAVTGSSTASRPGGGGIAPVAAIMLFFMGVTFVVGRVTAGP